MKHRVLCALLLCLTFDGCTSKKKIKMHQEEEGLDGGILIFADEFERPSIGDNWLSRSGRWEIKDGWLHSKGDRNEGIWLNYPLPDRVRIEFDAKSMSDDGDIKCEIFATDQRHQAGYIIIFGGWKNSISVIARLNEHGDDRMEKEIKVDKGRVYHFTLVRTGDVLRWYLDGNLVLSFLDEEPIRGKYFGFNNWASDLWFDNLKIYKL